MLVRGDLNLLADSLLTVWQNPALCSGALLWRCEEKKDLLLLHCYSLGSRSPFLSRCDILGRRGTTKTNVVEKQEIPIEAGGTACSIQVVPP